MLLPTFIAHRRHPLSLPTFIAPPSSPTIIVLVARPSRSCLTHSRLFVPLLVTRPRSCLNVVAHHHCPPLSPTFVAHLCRPPSSPTVIAHRRRPSSLPTIVTHRCCPGCPSFSLVFNAFEALRRPPGHPSFLVFKCCCPPSLPTVVAHCRCPPSLPHHHRPPLLSWLPVLLARV